MIIQKEAQEDFFWGIYWEPFDSSEIQVKKGRKIIKKKREKFVPRVYNIAEVYIHIFSQIFRRNKKKYYSTKQKKERNFKPLF